MDGHGDYHTKGSQKEKYGVMFAWKVKKKVHITSINDLIYRTEQTHRHREYSFGYQRANVGGRDRLTFESI